MDVPAILNLIEEIDRLKISNIAELLEYHETLPTHNLEYKVSSIDEALEDPSAVQLICAHLILRKIDKISYGAR